MAYQLESVSFLVPINSKTNSVFTRYARYL